ncbi:hypothetical protein lerEdw1_011930 [Lerista edwardsae]|nr:hypothetical protein lerEdw1_011930 [Lerista edwardsae]
MSNVRISNGSPTLERMEARQADYPKPSACRNLFGPVDHDALARELRKHRRELEEASRRQWNFDFQRHQPLDGRYEWRAVGSDALPDFYSRPPPAQPSPAAAARAAAAALGGLGCQRQLPRGGGADALRDSTGRTTTGTPVRRRTLRPRPLRRGSDLPRMCRFGAAHVKGCSQSGGYLQGTKVMALSYGGPPNTWHIMQRPAASVAVQRCPTKVHAQTQPDSSPRNKRANTTDEAVSEDSPSASSVEQTPKKSSPRRDQT